MDGAARTPTLKRARTDPKPLCLQLLLEQVKRLKIPSCDCATANRLLGPFVREALKFDDERGTLLTIVEQFGWQAQPDTVRLADTGAAGAAGAGAGSVAAAGEFCRTLDLGSFSLGLQVRCFAASSSVIGQQGVGMAVWEGNRAQMFCFCANAGPCLAPGLFK